MENGGATRDKANRRSHSEQEIGRFVIKAVNIPPKLMIVANWFRSQKISPLIDGICLYGISE